MNYFAELAETLTRLDPTPLLAFVQACEGTLWVCGNGGSAAIAQHWACDLSKAAGRRVQALGSNPAVLTAWANDDSYMAALAHELACLARLGDRLICLSVSGKSPNIVRAIGQARLLNMPCLLISRTASVYEGTTTIHIPSDNYGIVEDCFSAIGHWLTEALCETR